jgi:hypothetical protein
MAHRSCSLVAIVAYALLALVAPPASAAEGTNSAIVAAVSPDRDWNLALSPQPEDLALAEISFRRTGRRQTISPATLKLVAQPPVGDDYIAAATTALNTPGWLRTLVLVVNRPSPLLDPADVHLGVSTRRALGRPVVWKLIDPFSDLAAGLTPALCNLPLRGSTLAGSELRALRAVGQVLPGFNAASAAAQAYDVACGLPFEHAFEVDVVGSSEPAPAPTPVPRPPGCTPCDPAPGYACPLTQPSICAAPVEGSARRAAAGSH